MNAFTATANQGGCRRQHALRVHRHGVGAMTFDSVDERRACHRRAAQADGARATPCTAEVGR